jgi:thymidylate synthase
MNNLDKQYTDLLKTILEYGVNKEDRTGTGTRSIFGYTIRHNMADGFPLLTTKKMFFKGVVSELIWFLQGRTDLRYLLENNCHIWTGDAYKVYDKDFDREHPPFSAPYPHRLTKEEFEEKIISDDEFNKQYGDLGPIYGKQWRNWRGSNGMISEKDEDGVRVITWNRIDQIANLINDLKTNPDSRRLMVTAWNPAELDQMTLPPCHYGFQVYTRELSMEERMNLIKGTEYTKIIVAFCENPSDTWLEGQVDIILDQQNIPTRAISLMWNQRSVDTFLGLPFNIASYGLLLEIIAKAVNMVPDQLIGQLGDTHIYNDHFDQVNEQIGKELSIEERIDIASKKYETFDILDFGIPFVCTHKDMDELYPVERRTREPFPLPRLIHSKTDDFYNSLSNSLDFGHLDNTDFTLENYRSHSAIKAPLSN